MTRSSSMVRITVFLNDPVNSDAVLLPFTYVLHIVYSLALLDSKL